jgi:hypothetical protein
MQPVGGDKTAKGLPRGDEWWTGTGAAAMRASEIRALRLIWNAPEDMRPSFEGVVHAPGVGELYRLRPEEVMGLRKGQVLFHQTGIQVIKGIDFLDRETSDGFLAYGFLELQLNIGARRARPAL